MHAHCWGEWDEGSAVCVYAAAGVLMGYIHHKPDCRCICCRPREHRVDCVCARCKPAVGSQSVLAKLDEDKVRAIRASAESLKVLAHRYGVGMTVISNIRNRYRWKHI
jgi:hypothetical protein